MKNVTLTVQGSLLSPHLLLASHGILLLSQNVLPIMRFRVIPRVR